MWTAPCVFDNFDFSYFLTFFSECAQASDCPNGGTNYECNSNVCQCAPNFVEDGDACVGMLHHLHKDS